MTLLRSSCFIIPIILPFLVMKCLPDYAVAQACQKTCGSIPIRYPFGTGPGCGDPHFQSYTTCNQQQQLLSFSTHTGCYPITSIDYTNQILYITDPSMSTCFCTQPSKGFSLDWNAPFSFHDTTVFALLDCSVSSSSSPIYKSINNNNNNNGANNTGASASLSLSFSLCDAHGADICSLLYSNCQAVSRLNIPVSSCCVYTPVDLGPSFEMDLQKLQCSSYSGFYDFNGQESDPDAWKYGVALKYKFNFDNDYPAICAACEKSNGACGYKVGPYNYFSCNCPGGYNTTTDCFYGASWSEALKPVSQQTIGTLLIYSLVLWFTF